jgi:hypothetical protein
MSHAYKKTSIDLVAALDVRRRSMIQLNSFDYELG